MEPALKAEQPFIAFTAPLPLDPVIALARAVVVVVAVGVPLLLLFCVPPPIDGDCPTLPGPFGPAFECGPPAPMPDCEYNCLFRYDDVELAGDATASSYGGGGGRAAFGGLR